MKVRQETERRRDRDSAANQCRACCVQDPHSFPSDQIPFNNKQPVATETQERSDCRPRSALAGHFII